MTRLENDPRLTAYALDELDPNDLAEIEAILAADPAARAAVESIRAAAERLCATLAAEPTPVLDDFRRADLASSIGARSASQGFGMNHGAARAAGETLTGASDSDSLSAAPAISITRRLLRPWFFTASAAAAAIALVATGLLMRGDGSSAKPRSLWLLQFTGESTPGTFVCPSGPDTEENLRTNALVDASQTSPAQPVGSPFNSKGHTQDGAAIVVAGGALEMNGGTSPAVAANVPAAEFLPGGTGDELAIINALRVDMLARDEAARKQIVGEAVRFGDANPSMQPRFQEGAYLVYGRAERFPQHYYLGQSPTNRFEFAGYENRSYGYQVPFGTRGKPGQPMNVRAALDADPGRLFRAGAEVVYAQQSTDTLMLGDIPILGLPFNKSPVQSLGYAGQSELPPDITLPQFLTLSEEFGDRDALVDFRELSLPLLGWEDAGAENYGPVHHNPFLAASSNPLSTFSIDVDTASYANVRRFLLSGQLPPPAAVRIEEFLNYFTYGYPIPGQAVEPGSERTDSEEGSKTWLPTDAGMPQAENHRLETGATTESDPPLFSASMEVASCPWATQHRLVRIGLRGWEPSEDERPTASLVFLVDVSGSMNQPNKLPLVVQSLKLLVERLRDDDRIAIAVYAGASGLALPSTLIRERGSINAALDNLSAGGSTNGGEGINLAYNLAGQSFIQGGINRVILCTDGDFNVGIADRNELQTLIETKAKSGVFLSVLGFGMGNLQDATLETLADRGNGNYAYIDSLDEARKVLVDQMGGTLQTIAKDVKIQVEFNPAAVGAYRLLGYENRMLAAQDFNDNTKDAGEIGAGHTVTALYEVVPVGVAVPQMAADAESREGIPAGVGARRDSRTSDSDVFAVAPTLNDVVPPPPSPIILEAETPEFLAPDPAVDPLKYHTPDQLIEAQAGGPLELLTLKLRYKEPDGDTSKKLEFVLDDAAPAFDEASPDFRFAAAVAGFAMNLRGTPHISAWPLAAIAETALTAMGEDADKRRAEFLSLVKQAQSLQAAE